MGTGVEIAVMAAVVGSTVAKMGTENAAADERTRALEMQAQQLQLKHQQKTLSNLDLMENVLDSQKAAMTVRGVDFSSASFNAIQRDTLNIGAKRQKNIDIENALDKSNIDIEKENVKNSLYAQLFGDVAGLAMGGINLYNSSPSKPPSKLPTAKEK